jgi:RNA polymerase sigma-70 factor, ECF subfamily
VLVAVVPEQANGADEFGQLLAAARNGDKIALGELLERWRLHLLVIANENLDDRLGARLGASDIVQDAIAGALSDFETFHGSSAAQLQAWLCTILDRKISFARRTHIDAKCRGVHQEKRLEIATPDAWQLRDPSAGVESPSDILMERERKKALDSALAKLSEYERTVIEMHFQDTQASWADIGGRIDKTGEAARKLFVRALEKLKGILQPP